MVRCTCGPLSSLLALAQTELDFEDARHWRSQAVECRDLFAVVRVKKVLAKPFGPTTASYFPSLKTEWRSPFVWSSRRFVSPSERRGRGCAALRRRSRGEP